MSYPFNDPVQYYLVKDSGISNLEVDFKKINDYLLTFVGDVAVKKEKEGSIEISFSEVDFKSTLETGSSPNASDQVVSSQMLLTCEKTDNLSVHLLKNITKNIGYRIFNLQTKSYLVNNPDMFDLTQIKVKQNILKVIDTFGLTPFSQHRSALIFYATDKEGRVHLVNRHLLEYLIKNSKLVVKSKDFSVVVAEDMGRYVALFDRGLIPYSFYKCISRPDRIMNQSGFDLDKLHQDVVIDVIYFQLDLAKQSFRQVATSNLNQRFQIKKGGSAIKEMAAHLEKRGEKYLVIKSGIDIDYLVKKTKILPRLSVSIYLDD